METLQLDEAYAAIDGSDIAMDYDERHGVKSLGILTVTTDEHAALVASHLEERLTGKTVVEIGGGIGLLAMHLSQFVERIFVIEANPVWTSVAVAMFYARKPKNVTFIFGSADEMVGQLKADVAIFCTHSDAAGMKEVGVNFAPLVIDVYGDIVAEMDVEEWVKQARN